MPGHLFDEPGNPLKIQS